MEWKLSVLSTLMEKPKALQFCALRERVLIEE